MVKPETSHCRWRRRAATGGLALSGRSESRPRFLLISRKNNPLGDKCTPAPNFEVIQALACDLLQEGGSWAFRLRGARHTGGGWAQAERQVGTQGAFGSVGCTAPSRPEEEQPRPARPAGSGPASAPASAPRPVLGSELTPPPRCRGQEPRNSKDPGGSRSWAPADATQAEREVAYVVRICGRDEGDPESRRGPSLREGIGF
ncbi:uncharacterized protein LOC125102548 [Lutra lutra]|uniref:uncharacterized protein LOC125102548 n=1 Tax=Lutra lutra TaxID=9657 RepID=UPI001FD0B718|nr:uncharacterized protein LOC125102548 [Lutra lutra]